MPLNEVQATNQHMLPMGGYIRAKTLAPMLGISIVTLWRWSADGKIPKPVKLGERVTAWRTEDVCNWMIARNKGRTEK